MTTVAHRPADDVAIDLSPDAHGRGLVSGLHRELRGAIVSGRLAPGLRLPSTRAFAARHGVSRNTACAVYDLLVAEGFLTARQGAGTFVTDVAGPRRGTATVAAAAEGRWPMPPRVGLAAGAPAPRPGDLDLRMGVVDQSLFPWDLWRRMTLRAIREHENHPSIFVPSAGPEALRSAISGHVSFARAVASRPDDVVVTAGAQHAFDLLARILVTPGETVVAVEEPGYPPARAALLAAGARLAPVPVDGEGIVTDRIPVTASVVFVTPSHQFPTGVPMSLARRQALLSFAAARGAVVIEDDYDCEFRYDARPLDALQTLDRAETVVYVGTFSKTMFPGVRTGFIVAPPALREALVALRRIAGFTGPTIDQNALAAFIAEGHLARHVRRMRRVYAERRAALLSAIAHHCAGLIEPTPSAAGLHVTARVTGGASVDAVMDAASAAGIVIERLDAYATTGIDPAAVAFGFGATAPDRLVAAIDCLGMALRGRMQSRPRAVRDEGRPQRGS